MKDDQKIAVVRVRCRVESADLPTLSRTRLRERTGYGDLRKRDILTKSDARNGCYRRGGFPLAEARYSIVCDIAFIWRGQ